MKIIVPVCNNPTFIKLQAHGFAKHIHEPYEFIVFNDCKRWPDFSNFDNPGLYDEIHALCSSLNIRCIDVPNEHHKTEEDPSNRHASTMTFMFSFMKENPDEYVVFDSDMFMIDTLDMNRMRQSTAVVVLQDRPGIRYFWPNLFYMDMHRVKQVELLAFYKMAGADAGGETHVWLNQQAASDVGYIHHLPSLTWDTLPKAYDYPQLETFLRVDPRNVNRKFFCEIYDTSILHYRAGSNWLKNSFGLHKELTKRLSAVLLT